MLTRWTAQEQSATVRQTDKLEPLAGLLERLPAVWPMLGPGVLDWIAATAGRVNVSPQSVALQGHLQPQPRQSGVCFSMPCGIANAPTYTRYEQHADCLAACNPAIK